MASTSSFASAVTASLRSLVGASQAKSATDVSSVLRNAADSVVKAQFKIGGVSLLEGGEGRERETRRGEDIQLGERERDLPFCCCLSGFARWRRRRRRPQLSSSPSLRYLCFFVIFCLSRQTPPPAAAAAPAAPSQLDWRDYSSSNPQKPPSTSSLPPSSQTTTKTKTTARARHRARRCPPPPRPRLLPPPQEPPRLPRRLQRVPRPGPHEDVARGVHGALPQGRRL